MFIKKMVRGDAEAPQILNGYSATTPKGLVKGTYVPSTGGTAGESDILEGKTATTDSGLITGTMRDFKNTTIDGNFTIVDGVVSCTIDYTACLDSDTIIENETTPINPANILEGTQVLNIEGTMLSNAGLTKITDSSFIGNKELSVSVPQNAYYDVNSSLKISDNNFVSENIKKDVNLFGVVGTFQGGGHSGVEQMAIYTNNTRPANNLGISFEDDFTITSVITEEFVRFANEYNNTSLDSVPDIPYNTIVKYSWVYNEFLYCFGVITSSSTVSVVKLDLNTRVWSSVFDRTLAGYNQDKAGFKFYKETGILKILCPSGSSSALITFDCNTHLFTNESVSTINASILGFCESETEDCIYFLSRTSTEIALYRFDLTTKLTTALAILTDSVSSVIRDRGAIDYSTYLFFMDNAYVYQYDKINNSWTKISRSCPNIKQWGKIDGLYYGYGGGPVFDTTTILNQFDPVTGTFSTVTTSGTVPESLRATINVLDTYNNRLFIFGGYISTSSTPSKKIRFLSLEDSDYDEGTVIIIRRSNFIGQYRTQLIKLDYDVVGEDNIFLSSFDEAYYSDGEKILKTPVSYGTGSGWINLH